MSDPDNLSLGVAQKLTRSAKQGRTFETAQVKIIGLGEVRNAAGARMNTITFLQAALNDDDIVIPCGDGFLVICDQPAARNLDAEMETLQLALNAFYRRQEGYSSLRTTVTQHTMSSREVVGVLAGDVKENPQPQTWIRFAPVNRTAGRRKIDRHDLGVLPKIA